MHRSIVFAGTIAAALALTALPVLGQNEPGSMPETKAPPPSAGSHGGPHEQLPKPTNLKVLPKDISTDDLKKIMENFAGSLGVKCGFCHERNAKTGHLDFASDAKDDKQIARIMMKMTHDINENFMSQVKDPDAMPEDKHVACGTCHRGHKMPEHFIVPKPKDDGPPNGAMQMKKQ
jgi:hypothetical protein